MGYSNKFVVVLLIFGDDATLASLLDGSSSSWLAIAVQDLVFILHELVGHVVLELLDGLCEGGAEDGAALGRTFGGVEGVGNVCVRLGGGAGLDGLLIARRVSADIVGGFDDVVALSILCISDSHLLIVARESWLDFNGHTMRFFSPARTPSCAPSPLCLVLAVTLVIDGRSTDISHCRKWGQELGGR